MKHKVKSPCVECGRDTWRQPDKNGDAICAMCNEKQERLKVFIKNYLIELGVIGG